MKNDPRQCLLEHSHAKVTLLEKYLQKYLNVISQDGYTEKIFLFDLFCGEGIYENDGEGSPIAILRTVNNLFVQKKKIKQYFPAIDICFNDKDVEKIEKLKIIIKERNLHDSAIGQLKFRTKLYKDILPDVQNFVNSLKKNKAFIFIDPYGYKDIRASDIKNLLKSGKSEVLLFLPTQFMYRFDDKGTPQALIEIIEELTEQKHLPFSKSIFFYIQNFTEALRKHLGKNYFVDTFTIQKDANTVFCLFFFSSHIKGFEKMLETKWELDDDEGRGFKYEKSGNLFTENKTSELRTKLLLFLKEYRTNAEIYLFTLTNGFLPKHVNYILKELEAMNMLISESEKRKNAFYINYKSYRDAPNKIKIKINENSNVTVKN